MLYKDCGLGEIWSFCAIHSVEISDYESHTNKAVTFQLMRCCALLVIMLQPWFTERWWAAEENVRQLTSVGKLHLNITNADLRITSGRGHIVLDLCCMLLVYFIVLYLMITLCIPPKLLEYPLLLHFHLTKYPNINAVPLFYYQRWTF